MHLNGTLLDRFLAIDVFPIVGRKKKEQYTQAAQYKDQLPILLYPKIPITAMLLFSNLILSSAAIASYSDAKGYIYDQHVLGCFGTYTED